MNFKKTCSFLYKNNSNTVGLGGGLDGDSFEFINKIKFDRFETRKVVFKNKHDKKKFSKALSKATEFEICCLQFKHDFFKTLAYEDMLRLQMLKKRLSEL